MYDAHCHIQFPSYDEDRDAVILRAKSLGVKMIVVGTQYASSVAAIKLAEKYPDDVLATVGFHPNHALPSAALAKGGSEWHHDKNEQKQGVQEMWDSERFEILASYNKVVAIGECGLDYYRLRSDDQMGREAQKQVFIEQVQLATMLQKPLMIHVRDIRGSDQAYEDILYALSDSRFTLGRILHFYAGSLSVTKKFVEAGYYFTFGGVITFSNDYDEIIKYIPDGRIMLETDAPYVAPVPYRGKRNEPAYVLETAKHLAEIKNVLYDEFCATTEKTTKVAFQIN